MDYLAIESLQQMICETIHGQKKTKGSSVTIKKYLCMPLHDPEHSVSVSNVYNTVTVGDMVDGACLTRGGLGTD